MSVPKGGPGTGVEAARKPRKVAALGESWVLVRTCGCDAARAAWSPGRVVGPGRRPDAAHCDWEEDSRRAQRFSWP